MNEVEYLGFSGGPTRLRLDNKEMEAIQDYPTPTSAEEFDNFLFMITYLQKLIPGRAEHANWMKDAVQTTPQWRTKPGINKNGTLKRAMGRRIIGFSWGLEQ